MPFSTIDAFNALYTVCRSRPPEYFLLQLPIRKSQCHAFLCTLYFQLSTLGGESSERDRVSEMADKLEALHDSLSEEFQRFKHVSFPVWLPFVPVTSRISIRGGTGRIGARCDRSFSITKYVAGRRLSAKLTPTIYTQLLSFPGSVTLVEYIPMLQTTVQIVQDMDMYIKENIC